MKYIQKILFLFIIFTINNLFVNAQTYDFRNYSLEEGLPQSQVLSICQDLKGNIWTGTNGGGVGLFDGNKFENFTENDGLANNVVYSISLMKNGNILLGTDGGLCIYDWGKFNNYTEKDGLTVNRIFKAVEDINGTIWIGSSKGVFTLKNNKITPFTIDSTLNNSSVWTIFIDNSNTIWFGTRQNGVISYETKNKTFSYYNESNGMPNNYIWSINEDSNGNKLIGTNFGIRKITPNKQIEKIPIAYEENISFYSISVSKQQTFFATTEGLYKYTNGTLSNFKTQNGIPSDIIISSLIDRENNLWIGTNGFGISKISSDAFKSYSTVNGLPEDYISVLFQDSKDNMWIGITQYGIIKLKNNKFINYKTKLSDRYNSLVDDEVQAICEDTNGNILLGTKNGLSVFNGKIFKSYKLSKSELQNNIYCIIKNSRGGFWIGTNNGLYTFEKGVITPIPLMHSFISKEDELPIYCILEDKKHSLWIGTEKGIIKYTEKATSFFNSKNGTTNKRVSSIVQDGYGNLWFGTADGIFKYDYKKFYNINEKGGLSSNKTYLLLLDNNNLWVGTNKGLDKINLSDLYSHQKINIKHYGKLEGFKGIECNRNAAYKDNSGKLWFGTVKGAYIFDPKQEKTNTIEPITHITGIRLFFENADQELKKYADSIDNITHLPNNLILPYDKNHITFDFIGICMTIPSKVQYQFKLEGQDDKWYPPTSETKATYSSLGPGDYTFYLKAMNNDGLWNKEPISFIFTILPPWWKTWWFYTILTVVVFGIISLFISLRTKNLKKAKIKLEQEVHLRTNQLREEKEKVEVINKEVLSQKAIIEAKNKDITDSIKYAKNIQEAILPPLSIIYQEFKEVFILYQPKDIVSGDFYWFTKRNRKRLIAAVDCTGHGVPGAFMSIVGNTLLNEIVAEKNILEPAKILDELHQGVKDAFKQDSSENERRDGMDIVICSLNEENTILEYAGANRPLWIFRGNKPNESSFEIIPANKFAIGGIETGNKKAFTNHFIPVEKGDIIYLFSDGYADQFGGEKGKKFMVGSMQKKVTSISHLSIKEQEKELIKTFNDWKGNLEQVDDVLVIALKI